MIGLKENVIIGKLIPAGTGYSDERETSIEINKLAAELKAKRNARNHVEEESEMMNYVSNDSVNEDVIQDMIDDEQLSVKESIE